MLPALAMAVLCTFCGCGSTQRLRNIKTPVWRLVPFLDGFDVLNPSLGRIDTEKRMFLVFFRMEMSGHTKDTDLLQSQFSCVCLDFYSFLGAFAKLRKATISHVRLSAWNNSAPTGRILMKLDIWDGGVTEHVIPEVFALLGCHAAQHPRRAKTLTTPQWKREISITFLSEDISVFEVEDTVASKRRVPVTHWRSVMATTEWICWLTHSLRAGECMPCWVFAQ